MTDEPASRSQAPESGHGLVPGAVFARQYTIVRLLGAGGMGVVYEAERRGQDEHVAIKVLHRHLVTNAQITKRFYREAELLRRLRGHHLVPLVDFGEDEEGRLYMALACVDGLPLDRHIGIHGLLPLRDAVLTVADVCAALAEAHEQGVIHRDLKPANVLLEKLADGKHRVRVLDFGLAKALRDPNPGSSALTDQHMIFGTPEYMSPEQVKGEDVDERCDVYAAGVLLYELLTGKPPFLGKTGVGTMTMHLTDAVEPPSARAPERRIAKALDAVAMHALAKERDERYRSAKELLAALERALDAPEDVGSIRPAKPKDEDLAHRDTDVAFLARREQVDPLGSTAQFTSNDVAPRASSPPSFRGSMTDPPVTPEQLSSIPIGAPPRPWAWIVVVAVAIVVGVSIGVFVAFR